MGVGLSFSHFPIAFVPLSASCLPPCLDVARYAFDKGDSQSARQQNEIALDSNDRLGLTFFHVGYHMLRYVGCHMLCYVGYHMRGYVGYHMAGA